MKWVLSIWACGTQLFVEGEKKETENNEGKERGWWYHSWSHVKRKGIKSIKFQPVAVKGIL